MTHTPEIVVAGAGLAALELVSELRELAGDHVHITAIAPDPEPLLGLADTLIPGFVTRVDPPRRRVLLRAGGTVGYDTLVLAPGARRLPAFEDALHLGIDDLTVVLAEIVTGAVGTVAFVAPTSAGWRSELEEAERLAARLGADVTVPAEDADRVVSLPLLRGPRIEGIPTVAPYGFIAVDAHGRVAEDVYALGDATEAPVSTADVAARVAPVLTGV